MSRQHCSWKEWAGIFRERSDRPLPPLEVDRDYSELPDSLARSLAIFQLGVSGGGTVISQASRTRLPLRAEGHGLPHRHRQTRWLRNTRRRVR